VVGGLEVAGVLELQAVITKMLTKRMATGMINFFNFSPFLEI
jgi:hypothetical protein